MLCIPVVCIPASRVHVLWAALPPICGSQWMCFQSFPPLTRRLSQSLSHPQSLSLSLPLSLTRSLSLGLSTRCLSHLWALSHSSSLSFIIVLTQYLSYSFSLGSLSHSYVVCVTCGLSLSYSLSLSFILIHASHSWSDSLTPLFTLAVTRSPVFSLSPPSPSVSLTIIHCLAHASPLSLVVSLDSFSL